MTKGTRERASARFSPWRLLPLVVIAAGFIAYFALGLHEYVSFETLRARREWLVTWTAEHHVAAALAYFVLYATIIALSVPGGALMTIAGGLLFGLVEGTVLVVLAATLGAVLVFLAARYALGNYLRARAGPALKRMEAGFREDAMSYLLVLRLVPIFPFWLVNLVPAFLGVPIRTFVIATFFGIIPGSLVYVSVGNGLGAVFDAGDKPDLGIIFKPEILLPIIGLAVLALLPVAYRKLRSRRA